MAILNTQYEPFWPKLVVVEKHFEPFGFWFKYLSYPNITFYQYEIFVRECFDSDSWFENIVNNFSKNLS